MDTPYIHTVMKSDADPLDFACGPPPEARIPIHAIRGRGAATATPHRFAKDARTVVGVGTPEELAANPASHTGRYLAPYLAAQKV